MKYVRAFFAIAILCHIVSTGCNFLPNPNADNIKPPCLQPYDSLVIRKLLDTNGLASVEVESVLGPEKNSRSISIVEANLTEFILIEELEQLPIKYLNLSRNSLASVVVTDSIITPVKWTLELSRNEFETIPINVLQKCNLEELSMDYNKISNIDTSILSFTEVDVFIRFNRLCNVSDTISSYLSRSDSLWSQGQECGVGNTPGNLLK